MKTTIAFLEAQVLRLNRIAGTPEQPYVNGKAQIGNYHLDGAYGGYALHRMGNESGGISDVLRGGHISKQDLSDRISAFIAGFEAAREPLNA